MRARSLIKNEKKALVAKSSSSSYLLPDIKQAHPNFDPEKILSISRKMKVEDKTLDTKESMTSRRMANLIQKKGMPGRSMSIPSLSGIDLSNSPSKKQITNMRTESDAPSLTKLTKSPGRQAFLTGAILLDPIDIKDTETVDMFIKKMQENLDLTNCPLNSFLRIFKPGGKEVIRRKSPPKPSKIRYNESGKKRSLSNRGNQEKQSVLENPNSDAKNDLFVTNMSKSVVNISQNPLEKVHKTYLTQLPLVNNVYRMKALTKSATLSHLKAELMFQKKMVDSPGITTNYVSILKAKRVGRFEV